MSDQNQLDWSNYWQGRTAEQVGDAMVGVGIERSAELATFWNAELSDLKKSATVKLRFQWSSCNFSNCFHGQN